MWLGQNATGSGTLYLNGGLVQASAVQPNNAPATSIAYFNGGTLQAATNSTDFLQVTSMVMSNGLVFDDGGFAVSINSMTLQAGDALGGGLIKQGAGTLYLDTGNTYTGTTLVNGGTLAGFGSIAGPVVVSPTGTIGAGEADAPGTLTLGSTPLTLQGTAALRISKNGGTPASDLITGISAVTYGGTLSLTNVTGRRHADWRPATPSRSSTPPRTAATSSALQARRGRDLAYSFNPAAGVVSVIPVASNPTNITFSVSGSSLTLSWPADHLGWIVQSNAVSVADPAAWFNIPGSDAVTTLDLTITPTPPQVFFRLIRP